VVEWKQCDQLALPGASSLCWTGKVGDRRWRALQMAERKPYDQLARREA
jgi:hypothetical protein